MMCDNFMSNSGGISERGVIERVEIDGRCREIDAEVARGVAHGIAAHQLAANEVVDFDGLQFGLAAHHLFDR